MKPTKRLERIYQEAYFADCGYDKSGVKRQIAMYGGTTANGLHIRAGLKAVLAAISQPSNG